MLLCDIGNSYFHFYRKGAIWKEPSNRYPKELNENIVYYISVNEKATEKLLGMYPDAIDLDEYLYLDTSYRGLGIDRKASCLAVVDGVVVDAGSAITVDIMENSVHLGGYILPGFGIYQKLFKSISKKLDLNLNFGVAIDTLPQNTADAMSYGVLRPIYEIIRNSCKNKRLYFTGGDGKFLSKFFEDSIYDESIVFKGMLKAIDNLK